MYRNSEDRAGVSDARAAGPIDLRLPPTSVADEQRKPSGLNVTSLYAIHRFEKLVLVRIADDSPRRPPLVWNAVDGAVLGSASAASGPSRDAVLRPRCTPRRLDGATVGQHW